MSEGSDGRDDDPSGPSHPRRTLILAGHREAEQVLLESFRSGRMPHAWLINGPKGIGKATLAYRMARFVLAHPDPGSAAVQSATSLHLDPEHPVARRTAASAQGDLLILERSLNDKGKLRQDIAVDDVRRTVNFFGSTSWDGGWRVAIVDCVEDLNASSANALLKVLEEPPERALLLLISNAPGRVMPTLRSRCRRLPLKPLAVPDVVEAAAYALGLPLDDQELGEAAQAAEGSVARAMTLLDGQALALRQRVQTLLGTLPHVDRMALHALGDAMAGTAPEKLVMFRDTVDRWLSDQLQRRSSDLPTMARLSDAWSRINAAARDVETYNLERKPFVFSVFGWLAEVGRG